MFSISTAGLPPLRSYSDAKNYFNNTPRPRSDKWGDNERPLDGNRAFHKALVKVDDEYHCKLHSTHVVQFKDPDTIVYRPWNSRSTRDFAEHFLWPVGRCLIYNTQNTFVNNDIYYAANDDIVIRKANNKWLVDPATPKCWRKVRDPDQLHELRTLSKPFMEWVNALYALSGNDGSHPWVEQKVDRQARPAHSEFYSRLLVEGKHEELLLYLLPDEFSYHQGRKYGHLSPTHIRKVLTDFAVSYIKIDYDAPIPKRKEK